MLAVPWAPCCGSAAGSRSARSITCADNSGASNLYLIAVKRNGERMNRLPAARPGSLVMCTVKIGKPALRKKIHPAVIIRQRALFRRPSGLTLSFHDNAGVIVSAKVGPACPAPPPCCP